MITLIASVALVLVLVLVLDVWSLVFGPLVPESLKSLKSLTLTSLWKFGSIALYRVPYPYSYLQRENTQIQNTAAISSIVYRLSSSTYSALIIRLSLQGIPPLHCHHSFLHPLIYFWPSCSPMPLSPRRTPQPHTHAHMEAITASSPSAFLNSTPKNQSTLPPKAIPKNTSRPATQSNRSHPAPGVTVGGVTKPKQSKSRNGT